MPPRVSILIPVYNAQPYLSGAIQSILTQTFTDFEIIAVNDGSTDESLDILNSLAKRDARLHIHSRPNTGIVGALNDGLSQCQGELIARMDADDLSLPNRLEKQVAFLDAHPDHVLVGSRVLLIDPDNLPIRPWVDEFDHGAIDTAHLNRGWPVVHPAIIMRRSAVEQIGCYRQQYATLEDLDLFLRLAEVGRLANLADVLLHYRQHFSSICHLHSDQQNEIRQAILEETAHRRGTIPPPSI
ncbi:MAG TPA: glycosyltransferase, partial [Tepidisphaeraceae bacterium]